MVRNPLGSTHSEATLKACLEHGAPEDALQAAKAEFHAHLASNKNQQTNYELVEDSELLSEDRELDSDNQGSVTKGPIVYFIEGISLPMEILNLAGAFMEYFLEGSAPLRLS